MKRNLVDKGEKEEQLLLSKSFHPSGFPVMATIWSFVVSVHCFPQLTLSINFSFTMKMEDLVMSYELHKKPRGWRTLRGDTMVPTKT